MAASTKEIVSDTVETEVSYHSNVKWMYLP